jgi:hypothetical protein
MVEHEWRLGVVCFYLQGLAESETWGAGAEYRGEESARCARAVGFAHGATFARGRRLGEGARVAVQGWAERRQRLTKVVHPSAPPTGHQATRARRGHVKLDRKEQGKELGWKERVSSSNVFSFSFFLYPFSFLIFKFNLNFEFEFKLVSSLFLIYIVTLKILILEIYKLPLYLYSSSFTIFYIPTHFFNIFIHVIIY